MLDMIMDLVKGQVMDTVGGVAGIPENKKAETVETTTNSLMEGLAKYATPENIAAFTSMLGAGSKAGGQSANMASGLESGVVSSLTSKVGLSPQISKTIAAMAIPAVMALLGKKVNSKSEPGFNIGSLMGALTGGKSQTGGVMDMVGSLLGKKMF